MFHLSRPRVAPALVLSVAAIAGCATLPTVQTSRSSLSVAKTTPTTATAVATPAAAVMPAAAPAFVTAAIVSAVTSDTVLSDDASAKAMALNDEQLIEGISAALELDEAALSAAFSVASVGRGADTAVARPPVQLARNLRPAAEPARQVSFSQAQLAELQARRSQAQARQVSFEAGQPSYAGEAATLKRAAGQAPWQTNADDASTLVRRCDTTVTLSGGRQRQVQLVRVVGKGAAHPLMQARFDMTETCTDGATKVVRWEKNIQADGGYSVSFHHEVRHPQGHGWVTDWEKTVSLGGRIRGQGTFMACDRAGKPMREQPVAIAGDERAPIVTCPVASPSPTPSPEVSASPTAAPTATPTATPTIAPTEPPTPAPTPTPCTDGAVSGGGRLADTVYAFGFGPQVVTINDVTDPGNDYQADVRLVTVNGASATLTGQLRAPRSGTLTLVVTDNGEGAGDPDDTVTFMVGGRVIASGPLTRGTPGGGNLQVRPACE